MLFKQMAKGKPKAHLLLFSSVFAKRNYRVLLRVCVSVCLCVFLNDNSKGNRSSNMKFKHIVVYENIADKFDIEHFRTKVKVTAQL